MTIPRTGAAVVLLAILSIAAPAHAGWLNASLRELGLLWSDGYHSRSHCPPSKNENYALPALPELLPATEPTPAPLWGASSSAFSGTKVKLPSQMARPTLPASSLR